MTISKRFLVTGALVAAALVATAVSVAATLGYSPPGMPGMGTTTRVTITGFHGYYDGHVDTFLSTDVSSPAGAKMMKINLSRSLAKVPESAAPDLYLFAGKTAPKQLPVFASEPGEKDYSPIWDEVVVTFKPGTTPVLLTSDEDIEDAEKNGQVTLRETHSKLNCPIVKVGASSS